MTAPLMFNSSVTEQIPRPHRGPLLSDGSTRMWSPMTSRIAAMRCADGSPIVCSSQPARAIIASSWQRSRLSGLSPSSTMDALSADDYDTSSRLLWAADPVLNTMAAALARLGLLRDVGRPRRTHRRDALGLRAHATHARTARRDVARHCLSRGDHRHQLDRHHLRTASCGGRPRRRAFHHAVARPQLLRPSDHRSAHPPPRGRPQYHLPGG